MECVWLGGKAQLRGLKDELWLDLYIHNSCVCYNRRGEHDAELLSVWHYQITEPAPAKEAAVKPVTVSTAEAITAVLAGAISATSATEGRRRDSLVLGYGYLRCLSSDDNSVVGIPVDERWVIKHKKPEPIELEIHDLSKPHSMFDVAYEAVDNTREHWDGNIKVTCTVEAVD